MALINLPKRSNHKFFSPNNSDLILTAAAMTASFSFWNAINIRPSMLVSPVYRAQRERIKYHMNISLAAIFGMSTLFAVIYGHKGYIPAAAAAGTGILMYAWTNSELNCDWSGSLYQELPQDQQI